MRRPDFECIPGAVVNRMIFRQNKSHVGGIIHFLKIVQAGTVKFIAYPDTALREGEGFLLLKLNLFVGGDG